MPAIREKISTSTVAALSSKMALTGHRVAMVVLVFSNMSISTIGVEGASVCFLALWVVVVGSYQFPDLGQSLSNGDA